MRRVLDIELFLVRLATRSATLVPAPGLLLDQPPNQELKNGALNLKRWNSGSLAEVLGMPRPAPEGLEDLLLKEAQIIVFLGTFVVTGRVGSPAATPQRGLG
jgi:hypothetical protein